MARNDLSSTDTSVQKLLTYSPSYFVPVGVRFCSYWHYLYRLCSSPGTIAIKVRHKRIHQFALGETNCRGWDFFSSFTASYFSCIVHVSVRLNNDGYKRPIRCFVGWILHQNVLVHWKGREGERHTERGTWKKENRKMNSILCNRV